MMRRITQLRDSESAKVTLVFQASEAVHVQWFAEDYSRALLDKSEIPGFLPVQGKQYIM